MYPPFAATHDAIQRQESVLLKGHFLTDEDLEVKKHIIQLACSGQASLDEIVKSGMTANERQQLVEMEEEGLLKLDENRIEVTELGFKFIRNICKVFDARLNRKKSSEGNLFSKAI